MWSEMPILRFAHTCNTYHIIQTGTMTQIHIHICIHQSLWFVVHWILFIRNIFLFRIQSCLCFKCTIYLPWLYRWLFCCNARRIRDCRYPANCSSGSSGRLILVCSMVSVIDAIWAGDNARWGAAVFVGGRAVCGGLLT